MNIYIKALRAPFLAGSVVPVIIGICLAFKEGHFIFSFSWITIVGVAALHLGANLLNDFYDAKGSDPINIRLTPFSGGSRVIQDGEFKAGTILVMAILFFALALASALWLAYAGRPLVFLIGFLGLFAGWAYSAPPLQLMSRGWGEIAIFFAFGPLITLGAYYVMSGQLTWQAFLVGFPQGFLITGVIWINQFPDYQADKEAGKRNLVVRLGLGASRYLYCLIMIFSFVTIVFLVGVMGLSYLTMIAFASFPLTFKAMKIAWKKHLTYEGLIPAQALTVQMVMAQGLLLSLGIFLSRFMNI
ncbi:MAG: prenyltransferase [Deltaproteobacteria bacterium]|nr:prenyltransferase [Deltaproteobacteria bacterium]